MLRNAHGVCVARGQELLQIALHVVPDGEALESAVQLASCCGACYDQTSTILSMTARDARDDRTVAERFANAYLQLLRGLSAETRNSALAEHLRRGLRLWRMRSGRETPASSLIPSRARLL